MNSALTQKILITFGFLFAYRVLAYIPVPGVDTAVIASFFDSNSGGMLGMANMFSGNAISRMQYYLSGIMPYITASIVMELLAATFPRHYGQMNKMREKIGYWQKFFGKFFRILQPFLLPLVPSNGVILWGTF